MLGPLMPVRKAVAKGSYIQVQPLVHPSSMEPDTSGQKMILADGTMWSRGQNMCFVLDVTIVLVLLYIYIKVLYIKVVLQDESMTYHLSITFCRPFFFSARYASGEYVKC